MIHNVRMKSCLWLFSIAHAKLTGTQASEDSSVSCLHTSNRITDVCYYMKLFYVSCGFKFTTELTIYSVSEYSS